jgi:hypothetical protein
MGQYLIINVSIFFNSMDLKERAVIIITFEL